MRFDETIGWNIDPYGDTWRITTTTGDTVADGIPYGELAHYIANMHNTKVRARKNFRITDIKTLHPNDGDTVKQCNASAHPYRCMYSVGHTGPHVAHGITTVYLLFPRWWIRICFQSAAYRLREVGAYR